MDLERREKVRFIEMPPLKPETQIPAFYPHNVNHGLRLTPDEQYLFANGSIEDYVAVFSHPNLDLVKTIPVGSDPNSIAFSKDGAYCYISNRKSDDLSIISVADLTEIKRLKLGKYPQRMAVVSVPERE